MLSTFGFPRPPIRSAPLARLLLTVLIVMTALAGLAPVAKAVQPPPQTWTEASGAFTVQWSDPWVVQRQETGLVAVANGSTIAVATTVVPAAGINPSLCLDA